MITLYGVLKFLHVLGASIWLGSNATTVALRALVMRAPEVWRTLWLVRETDRIQVMLVSPAFLALIGTGIWLVLEGGWGFDRFFVIVGLSAVAASAIFGALFTSSALKKLKSLVNVEHAADLDGLLARIQLGIFLDLALVIGVVFVMVTKPTI
jgi:uncharacterized membrane protein